MGRGVLDVLTNVIPFAFQIALDRVAQPCISNPMCRVGCARAVAPGNLMSSLGARFDPIQAVRDGEVDRLVVADLEVQEAMILDATPVAAEQSVGADEVECSGDVAALAAAHDQ